jgi:hypothetical protein
LCLLVLPFSPQQPEDDRQAAVDRQERRDPALQVVLALLRRQVQPVVVGGEIEFAHAAGESRCAA